MSLEIQPADASRPYALVRLGGRLDAHSADEYKPRLQELLAAPPAFVVGDLSDLKYISSAGLNLLIHLCRESRKTGGDFRLAGVQAYVREILDLTGYTKIFKMYDTVDQASASIVVP
jgi:anti-anti-sigma factor